jgi:hypothetical protein
MHARGDVFVDPRFKRRVAEALVQVPPSDSGYTMWELTTILLRLPFPLLGTDRQALEDAVRALRGEDLSSLWSLLRPSERRAAA